MLKNSIYGLFVSIVLLSGCTATKVLNAYSGIESIEVYERGQSYRLYIHFERKEALISRELLPTIGDSAFQYVQRQLGVPEAALTWQSYQRNNAQRALVKGLGKACDLQVRPDGSALFFTLNGAYTIFSGDINCGNSNEDRVGLTHSD